MALREQRAAAARARRAAVRVAQEGFERGLALAALGAIRVEARALLGSHADEAEARRGQAQRARELRQLWESREVEKQYWAIVHGHVAADEDEIDAPLGKDEASEVAVKDCVRADGHPSQTRYWTQWRFERAEGKFSWLRGAPVTGRKHQIRIHLQHLGHPIVGDKLYGEDALLYLKLAKGELTAEDHRRLILKNQALHAHTLRFAWRGRDWEFVAEPADDFVDFIETVSRDEEEAFMD